MKKKAQIGMFETIAVLVVFFMLLAMGLIFYSYYSANSAQDTINEYDELTLIGLTQRVAHVPELKCTKGDITVENCFDTVKLMAFEQSAEQSMEYYQHIFLASTIEAIEIYPNGRVYNIYNNSGGPLEVRAEYAAYVPLSLYDPLTDIYSMGYLKVVYTPYKT